MSLDVLDPTGIYHLATAAEWAGYQQAGSIEPASLGSEGFVHCSYGHQVGGTVAKHFAGVPGLLALHLDVTDLAPVSLVIEDSYGSGQEFPHAYGPIPVQAVVGTVPIS